jgi:hypothetical protein
MTFGKNAGENLWPAGVGRLRRIHPEELPAKHTNCMKLDGAQQFIGRFSPPFGEIKTGLILPAPVSFRGIRAFRGSLGLNCSGSARVG